MEKDQIQQNFELKSVNRENNLIQFSEILKKIIKLYFSLFLVLFEHKSIKCIIML
jgi:hypothetical protein